MSIVLLDLYLFLHSHPQMFNTRAGLTTTTGTCFKRANPREDVTLAALRRAKPIRRTAFFSWTAQFPGGRTRTEKSRTSRFVVPPPS
jgi:hypothetical protein